MGQSSMHGAIRVQNGQSHRAKIAEGQAEQFTG